MIPELMITHKTKVNENPKIQLFELFGGRPMFGKCPPSCKWSSEDCITFPSKNKNREKCVVDKIDDVCRMRTIQKKEIETNSIQLERKNHQTDLNKCFLFLLSEFTKKNLYLKTH